MNFYTHVQQRGNFILVRGVDERGRFSRKESFSPRLFVRGKGATKYKTLSGDPVQEMRFDSINEAKDFIKTYDGVSEFPIYGNTQYQYQYIAENYPNDIQYDLSNFVIYSIDIETTSERGFPQVKNPIEEVLLITVQNAVTKKKITWGSRPYEKKLDNHEYVFCHNEEELLRRFIDWFNITAPDIITGWNINFFDVPYMVARINRVFGEEEVKKLSPWKVVNSREVNVLGREQLTFDILGVSILDYLDLYKKFTYSVQESYKLDYIAFVELGERKLENPYDTYQEFYTNAWELFVDYNIRDVELVDGLEDKMRLIELIITLGFKAKCNFSDVFSAVRTWDCLIYNHLWKKNIVIPQKVYQGEVRQIAGAYVKEPRPGAYNWVVSFDAASLYPSIIMGWNLSPETIINSAPMDVTIQELLDGKPNLTSMKALNHAMAANGYFFNRSKQGFFPEIVETMFSDRQLFKKKMLEEQRLYEETLLETHNKEAARYKITQESLKILMNSLYGAQANQYFRFYDDRIAEGITITGQYIIQKVGQALNDYLNKLVGTKGVDYAFYSDTDSCYITLDALVEKFIPAETPKEKIVDMLNKVCEDKIVKAINEACDELSDYLNVFSRKIVFKREVIADRGIWIAKKRYALNVYNSEGVQYVEPKLKVMGLEIVRSSTPAPVRDHLKEAVKICLTGTENQVQNYLEKFKGEFFSLAPEDIAFPRSVQGLEKYKSSVSIYGKGTPMHVRGSLLFNHWIKNLELEHKYEPIRESDRIKFLYLKEPNPIRENTIAFLTKFPPEFKLHNYVDYETMWQKSFIEPLKTILNCLNWSIEPQATLEDLFA